MDSPKTPGAYVTETSQPLQPIVGASTSTTAFVGVAASGPLVRTTPIASWSEFVSAFGGLSPTSEMSYAVWQFFQNGGTDAIVVRVADSANDPATLLSSSSPTGGGVSALAVSPFNLLVLAGVTDAATLRDAMAFCETFGAFLIADPPAGATPQTMAAYVTGLDPSLKNYAALYYPYLEIADPLTGTSRAVPPSGSVAGLYARSDAAHGAWKSPAGTGASLTGALGLAHDVTDADEAILTPIGVNAVRTFPGAGTLVWGARTMDAGSSDWRYVSTRRLAQYIEQSVKAGLQRAVFEPNDPALWATLQSNVGAFMSTLFHQGALAGSSPAQAYVVKCDAETNSPTAVLQGLLNVTVGFAPLKPAEFIMLTFQQQVQINQA